MGDMTERNQFQVHKALMESYDPHTATKVEQMAKDFYTSIYIYLLVLFICCLLTFASFCSADFASFDFS